MTMSLLLCLLLLNTGLAGASDSSKPVLEQDVERDILVSLYEYTNGDEWTNNDNWNDPAVHYCDWHGIQCINPTSSTRRRLSDVNAGRSIESIDLAGNNLKGSVPISLLLLLPNIRSISLNGNNVDYSKVAQQEIEVLGQVLDLPISVHSLIQHFDVSQTSVKDINRLFRSGNGDTVIQTPRLATFYATQSQIRGPFPDFLMDVSTMERLALDHNSITGTIPNTLGNLRSLKYISLSDNQLGGRIPETVNQLVKLRYILLELNRLTGTIPLGLTSTEYTPLLEQLDLSDQRDDSTPPGINAGLSGTIPAFDSQKRLRRIDLGVNSFSGTIPPTLLGVTDFTEFDFIILGSNMISGSVPTSVLSRIPPDSLFLENNRITELTNCPVSDYNCDAVLCPPGTYEPRSGRQEEDNRPCLSCPKNTLYWGQTICPLDGNYPTPPPITPPSPNGSPVPVPQPTPPPSVPPSGGGGSLTPAQEKAVLQDLYVAAGGADWINNDGWSDPNASSFCGWYGVVCVSQDVESVKFLALDANSLLGSLPSSIYSLPNLKSLDLSQNDGLTVTFEGIGKAKLLEAIDLSRTIITSVDGILESSSVLQELHINDVGGLRNQQMPAEVFRLTNLKQLSLDYNDATGSLPTDIGLMSKLVVFSVSNNQLTGTIPESITKLTDLATLRLSTNHFSGTLPQGMQEMSSLSLLDLSNQWSNGVDDDFATESQTGLHGPLPSFEKLSQIRRLDLGVNSFSGTVPEKFLHSVDPENLFEYADLGDNFLTGTVPSGVARLPNLYLHSNLITGIASEVCNALPADLQQFGCDAVLCAPGFSNSEGRQTSEENPCVYCNVVGAAQYFGSTDCSGPSQSNPTPAPSGSQPAGSPLPGSSERTALELIYTECGGAGWAAKENWLIQSVSICLWDGVQCDGDGKVSEITLRSNNLNGTFPSLKVFETIPLLNSLILDGNTVAFPFEGIDKAGTLETLDLTSTELTMVTGVGTAPNIKNLYLGSNNLKGAIPSELLQLTSLTRLALAFNDLSGPIPNEISVLSNLEFLSLHDNALTSTIPTVLGQMTNLVFLLLQTNNLSGTIPTQLNFLDSLSFFSVADQRGDDGKGLTGRIPSFATLTSVKKFDLSQNQLTGTVPADFLDRTSVESFEHILLNDNRLTGTLPSVLSKFPAEQYDVSNNQISALAEALCDSNLGGAVAAFGCDAVLCPPGKWSSTGRQLDGIEACQDCPESKFFGAAQCGQGDSGQPTQSPVTVSNLTDSEILSMLFDRTKGSAWHRNDRWKQSGISVCEWYGIRCDKDGNQRVEHIVLSANNIIGTVPSEIFWLPYLKNLVLDSNNIDVDISGIGSARRLELLDISATSTGSVAGIGAAVQLRELHIKQIGLSGTFPDEIFQLTALELLDFDFNSFSGPLSHAVGQLSNLKQLTGEKNELSGVLPDELRLLTSLAELRLGKNSFEGSVPASALDEMTSLSYIDLSRQIEHGGQGLSGGLPTLADLHSLTQVRLKDNNFSGMIPFNFLQNVNRDEFQYADLSSNALTGTVPASLAEIGDILLQNNMISDLPKVFCDASRGSAFAQYGCDAFLCKPGTYNRHGRQESNETKCEVCPEAKYFGSISCGESPASPPTVAPPSVNEREVLIKLFQVCGGNFWDETDNWLDENQSICTWRGVKCPDGSQQETVEKLELGGNNLKGTPPTDLFALPNLRSLSLYSNPLADFDFTGIEYANKLTELLLDATGINSINGIERAPSLELLNLRFNNIQGTFPTQIAGMTTLQALTLAYNDLTGKLPTDLEEMTNLKSLLLSHNRLSGNLNMVNFPRSIRRLDLSHNQITGSIPVSFLTLVPFNAELEVDISSNQITGSIPTDLTRFFHLNIYLKDNLISEISKQLCAMSDWNDGDVGKFGCNGLLCPAGDFAPNGRHSSSGDCEKCAAGRALHMGASTCDGSGAYTSRSGVTVLTAVASLFYCLWI